MESYSEAYFKASTDSISISHLNDRRRNFSVRCSMHHLRVFQNPTYIYLNLIFFYVLKLSILRNLSWCETTVYKHLGARARTHRHTGRKNALTHNNTSKRTHIHPLKMPPDTFRLPLLFYGKLAHSPWTNLRHHTIQNSVISDMTVSI